MTFGIGNIDWDNEEDPMDRRSGRKIRGAKYAAKRYDPDAVDTDSDSPAVPLPPLDAGRLD